MQLFTIVLSVVMAGSPANSAARPAAVGPSVTVPGCLVSALEEAQVPAQEAGVLVGITAREGQQVAAGDVLGQIDTAQAELSQQVAGLQLQVAFERVSNDVNRRYAEKAAELAQKAYERARALNIEARGAVPEAEVEQLKLAWDKAILQIEQAQHDLKVFGLEAQVRQAELNAAKAMVDRMQIHSPLDGVVEKVHRHAGEWVKPGDPTFYVVRMDRLRIEGFLNRSKYAPWEIDGRPVTVEVELSGGQREQFAGRIESFSQSVDSRGDFRVWAEVVNRRRDKYWLLWPGQTTKMTIHLADPRSARGAVPLTTQRPPR